MFLIKIEIKKKKENGRKQITKKTSEISETKCYVQRRILVDPVMIFEKIKFGNVLARYTQKIKQIIKK